jgi:hypothetical protein
LRAAKVDANHAAIVKALRDAGWSVISLARLGAGIPDLCVAKDGQTYLIEVKNRAGKNKLNAEQKAFAASWRGRYACVESPEQALLVVEHPETWRHPQC